MRYYCCFFALLLAACSTPANNDNNDQPDAAADTSQDVTNGNDADSTTDTSSLPDVGQDTTSDTADTAHDSGGDTNTSDVADVSIPPPRGTCVVDTDCTTGTCGVVGDPVFGWFTCLNPYPEITACQGGTLGNECCKSSECTNDPSGVCLERIRGCSGIAQQPSNICYYDACASDTDCNEEPNGLCLPAGAFGTPAGRCSYGGCTLDAECDGTNSACVPFDDPCTGFLHRFSCVSDESICRTDEDCKDAQVQGIPYCAPTDDGMNECAGFLPPP